jgi:hypothetical protein
MPPTCGGLCHRPSRLIGDNDPLSLITRWSSCGNAPCGGTRLPRVISDSGVPARRAAGRVSISAVACTDVRGPLHRGCRGGRGPSLGSWARVRLSWETSLPTLRLSLHGVVRYGQRSGVLGQGHCVRILGTGHERTVPLPRSGAATGAPAAGRGRSALRCPCWVPGSVIVAVPLSSASGVPPDAVAVAVSLSRPRSLP